MHTLDALALPFRGNLHFGHIASDYRLRLSYSPPRTAGCWRSVEVRRGNRGRSPAGGPTVWRRHYEAKHTPPREEPRARWMPIYLPHRSPVVSPTPSPECFTRWLLFLKGRILFSLV